MSSNSDRELSGSEPRPTSLLDALEHLEAVAFVPSKQRYTDAGQLAKIIASNAYESGIPQAALERLVKLLTQPNNLDQGTITTLLKNLYPVEGVPSKLVTQVVCCLGPSKNKPAPATQNQLLRWLILVYDFFDDRAHLSKLYAVLFNYLDMISLRKPLCHLLSFITRRKHVKPFRIQALMELVVNSGGEDKELLTLMKVFKNYCPDVLVGDLGGAGRKALFFKHPDPEWTSHVRALQDSNAERLRETQSSRFQVVLRGTTKRSKMEVLVPSVQTSRVSYNHTSLEEIRGIDHFVERLEKIELPNQIVSAIGDNLAQKYLFLVQPEPAKRRLDDWLRSFFSDHLESGGDPDDEQVESLGYVLSLLVDYVRYTKEIPGTVASFLKSYIPVWNGVDNKEQLLQLLEYTPVTDYDTVRREFLSPLETSLLHQPLPVKGGLLDFYSSLVRQWGVHLRTQPFVPGEEKPLDRLLTHAELLALSILECPSTPQDGDSDATDTKPITLSVVEFYCTLAELFSYASVNGNIRITIPLASTVYSLVFTPISSVISIVSSVLASYKASFEASMTSQVLQVPDSTDALYPTQLVGQFNGYIMDICNLLWRNRALNSDDPNALGCLIPAGTVTALTQYIREMNEASRERKRDIPFSYSMPSLFSLSHHAALSNMSAACFAGIEDETNREDQPRLTRPVTQKALNALEKDGGAKVSWQEYRVRMLDWLEADGSVGVGNLMRSTMKALRKE
ncbi:Mis6 domain protein [Aspergillus campestris IBT 28561]|uniref:Mis6 domain protein n=1 Tax=Aspergillus campestris (strain IBT 28561) TaxID=1392248 RepID=A0A2I1DA90_ASPC2|nr:Mis6 domain protein [Aspergillus campestris IBT 28561]PKY06800.1 Mis6 domain protein [Aspergillus campestris IBT 28561]